MSGRVPVFIHFNGASSAPLGRRGLLRPFEEWQGRGKELLGALRLRHVTAALDQRDLRLWKGRVHVGQMAQREHEVLAAPHDERRARIKRRSRDPRVAQRPTHPANPDAGGQRSLDSEDSHRCDDEARVERVVGPEVAYAPRPLALPEARQIERNDLTPGRGKSAHDRPPVLGPATDTVNEQDRLANRAGSVLHEDAGTETLDRDRARLHLWLSCSQCSSTTSARSARSYTEKRIPRAPSRRTLMSTSG